MIPPKTPKKPSSTKIEPMLAWELNPEDTVVSRDALGVKYEKSANSKPFHLRLKCYYYFFLIYGIDISGNSAKSRKLLMTILRFLTMALFFFVFVWYWIETFLTLKEEYNEYGATLLNLVVTAHISSAFICHSMIHSRAEKMYQLIDKLDDTNSDLPFTKHDIKKCAVSFGAGIAFVVMYTLNPMKWVKGVYFNKDGADLDSKLLLVHEVALQVVQTPIMRFLVFMVCAYDVMSLSFFVIFSRRFYVVFRQSPFVKLLEKSTKDDLCLIMQEFRKHHFTICNFVEEVDGVFSPLILIWYVFLTLSLCCWIRAFNTAMFGEIPGAFTVMLSLVMAFTQFFILSSATSTINDEVTAHLDTVRIMCIKEDITAKASMDVVQERISHLSYVTCVLASPVTLTGWGFFSISKGFVLTVSSTVLTFTLVLYGV